VTPLAFLLLFGAVTFALLFLATFDTYDPVDDEEPTLNTRSNKGD